MSRTDLSRDLCAGEAERGESVQDGKTDPELRDLTVEILRQGALTQQIHTLHLRLDAAPAVAAAPSSPERQAAVFWRPLCLVARSRTCAGGLSRLCSLAWRNDGDGPAFGDGAVALARVVGAVGGDAGDLP